MYNNDCINRAYIFNCNWYEDRQTRKCTKRPLHLCAQQQPETKWPDVIRSEWLLRENCQKTVCVYVGGAWRNENISVEAALLYANEQLCTVANCTFDAFTSCFFSVLILQNFCSTSALIDVSVSIPLRRKLCGGRERLRLRRFAPPGERRTKRRTTVQSCKAKTLCKHIMVLNVAWQQHDKQFVPSWLTNHSASSSFLPPHTNRRWLILIRCKLSPFGQLICSSKCLSLR